jgi:uncharacterized protein (TIGR02271 family)
MKEHRIPVIEEHARVEKKVVERGVVRIDTFITEHIETISAALTREEIDIRHVAMNVEVDAAPAIRQEGDVIIIPVVEERIVVSKRLVLTEELHVHRRKVSEHASIPVTLRSTEIAVQRESSSGDEHVPHSSKGSEML